MRDVQSEHDIRGVEIDAVGISGLRHPLVFDDGSTRHTGISEIEMTVRLTGERRGTHMSRMVEIARDYLHRLDPCRLPIVLKAAAHQLDAPAVDVAVAFPLATRITSPSSGQDGWQVHDVTISGRMDKDVVTVQTTVETDVTSLCPCSKAISDFGAHNQRSHVTLSIFGDGDNPYPLAVLPMVEMIRRIGSAPVFSLLKRPDERTVTMQAYNHPAFVEDMVRDLSVACRHRNLAHRVSVRSIESIHSHDAIAAVRFDGDS